MAFKNYKYFIKDISRLIEWFAHFILYGTFNIPKIQKYHDEIFVLGNGPSLINDIRNSIDVLKDKDIMMVNQALSTDIAFQLKPKFYCLLDPRYWHPNMKDPYQSKEIFPLITELTRMINLIDWPMTIFVPNHVYKKRNKNGVTISNPLVKIQTFNALELYTFKRLEKILYSWGLAIPSTINVLIASLCCAITMQYKKIYLLGADSDWHKQIAIDNTTNQLYTTDTHYYDNEVKKIFIPERIDFIFDCISQAFKAYRELAKLGYPIYNLSSNSMIDAFPRDRLENVLERKYR